MEFQIVPGSNKVAKKKAENLIDRQSLPRTGIRGTPVATGNARGRTAPYPAFRGHIVSAGGLASHIGVLEEGSGPLGVGPTMRRERHDADQHWSCLKLIYRRARSTFCKNALSRIFSLIPQPFSPACATIVFAVDSLPKAAQSSWS